MPKQVRVLAIGGWDATARAGLLADVWAAQQVGSALPAIATCITVQGSRAFRVWPASPTQCEAQLQSVLATGSIDAIKVGAVPNAALARWVKSVIARLKVPTVVDPVIYTSRGERLSSLKREDVIDFARKGVVLTPNRGELEWLQSTGPALIAHGFEAVIVKGGDTAVDELFVEEETRRLRGKPVHRRTSAYRGTGCRFATALAIHLARGELVAVGARKAAALVRKYLQRPIIHAR
jgi:hydroxymethylpyrimidine/phosphomethylpyrimidine kinase